MADARLARTGIAHLDVLEDHFLGPAGLVDAYGFDHESPSRDVPADGRGAPHRARQTNAPRGTPPQASGHRRGLAAVRRVRYAITMTATGWRTTGPTPRAARPAARLHVVGLVLLAFALQALAPALHARILAAHATSSGTPLASLAFCLPSQSGVGAATPDDAPRSPRAIDCVCCAGAMASAAEPPAAPSVAAPADGVAARTVSSKALPTRVAPRHRPQQSRAPPSLV
ncbi:MAG: hypothetical protein IPK81_11970 [Rhodospirillales bacterium]|nr:MAG: hypothetical protein IPK81_11970 [Rhodospirillales bacterium]